MTLKGSYVTRINQHNFALAQYSSQIKYQESLIEPDTDLLHELKSLYEAEKLRLENAWNLVKEKGIEFLKEVFEIVKHVFEELVADVIAFLKRHGLEAIVEFLKELF